VRDASIRKSVIKKAEIRRHASGKGLFGSSFNEITLEWSSTNAANRRNDKKNPEEEGLRLLT